MKYIVHYSYDIRELIPVINFKIELGWVPLGGIAVSPIMLNTIGKPQYLQAMIKE